MLVNLLKKRTGTLTFCALRRRMRMASSSDSRDVVDVEETEKRGNSGLIEKSINRVTLLGRVGAHPREQCNINGENTWARVLSVHALFLVWDTVIFLISNVPKMFTKFGYQCPITVPSINQKLKLFWVNL